MSQIHESLPSGTLEKVASLEAATSFIRGNEKDCKNNFYPERFGYDIG